MATLYEMTGIVKELYDLLQAEEIDEQTFNDTLESIGSEQKLESYCKIIGQLNGEIDMFKAEAERISARKKTAENNVARMKQAIIDYLKGTGQDKAKAGTFSVALQKSKSVTIIDENLIPTQFLIPQPPKVDKMKIKEALNNGENVNGSAVITENESVRIR